MSVISQIKHTILSHLREDTKPLIKETLLALLDEINKDLDDVGYGNPECELSEDVELTLTKLDQVIAGTWTDEDEDRYRTSMDEVDSEEDEDIIEVDGEEEEDEVEYADEDLEDDGLVEEE